MCESSNTTHEQPLRDSLNKITWSAKNFYPRIEYQISLSGVQEMSHLGHQVEHWVIFLKINTNNKQDLEPQMAAKLKISKVLMICFKNIKNLTNHI